MFSEALVKEFEFRVREVSGEVYRVETPMEALGLITRLVKEMAVHHEKEVLVALGPVPLLVGLDVAAALPPGCLGKDKDMERVTREALVGVVQANGAIAGTGTLILRADDVDVRLISTLPLYCIALVQADTLVPDLKTALSQAGKNLPRYLSLITGPSRTSDIERVLTIGVHGPERLIVILVGGEGG